MLALLSIVTQNLTRGRSLMPQHASLRAPTFPTSRVFRSSKMEVIHQMMYVGAGMMGQVTLYQRMEILGVLDTLTVSDVLQRSHH